MTPTGTIFDIKKYAIHDGPGIRTTVFLKGCPLDCWWCHNPEGRNIEPETFCVRILRGNTGQNSAEKMIPFGRIVTVDEVLTEIQKDNIFYDQSGGGATFSGGEPLMQPEFLQNLLAKCKAMPIHTAVDTCGYAPAEAFRQISGLVDLFLYDLKLMDDSQHIKYTGVTNKDILDNLKMLTESGCKIHLRLPIIPEITDTPENLEAILSFIKPLSGIRDIQLLPYNRLAADKRERFQLSNRIERVVKQPEEEINRLADKFGSLGYKARVGG